MRSTFGFRSSLVILAALLAAGVGGCGQSASSGPKSSAGTNLDIASLVPVPPAQPTIFQKAQVVRRAIGKEDFAGAGKLVRDAMAQSHVGRWHYVPFSGFMDYVAAPADAKFSNGLNKWVKTDPKSPLPHLVRADYHYNRGWWIRGNDFAGSIEANHLRRFRNDMELAERDVETALQSVPDIRLLFISGF